MRFKVRTMLLAVATVLLSTSVLGYDNGQQFGKVSFGFGMGRFFSFLVGVENSGENLCTFELS